MPTLKFIHSVSFQMDFNFEDSAEEENSSYFILRAELKKILLRKQIMKLFLKHQI